MAQRFVDAFAREGFDVWWDDTIRSGDTFDEAIDAALRSAKAVVVLWSPRSVASRWVRSEATIADRNGTLMPAIVAPCDKPVAFELTQTAELAHWRGAADDPAWQAFAGDVRRMLGRDGPAPTRQAQSAVAKPPSSHAAWAAKVPRHAPILALLLLIAAAGAIYALSRRSDTASQLVAEAGKVSVAVLPFRNLSADKDQEFFSDGMTEEITSALARVPGLNVVARTSAFQFKGANRDMRVIGGALGASHLIEGSVRKEGNEVRITAQLVRAADGTQLWSESYNRELKGVFALQEDIAQAIAGALRVPLGLKVGQSLVANRTADTESYQDYLRARALVRLRGSAPEPGGPLTQAAKLLEQVVARDPNYAPAWAMLAQAYAITPFYTPAFSIGATDELRRIASYSLQKAETAAQQAARLDPSDADAYTALGFVRRMRGRHVEAEDMFKQALSLDPENSETLHHYSLLLADVGRVKEALLLRLRLQAQDPLVPQFNAVTNSHLVMNGRNDEVIAILKALPPINRSLNLLAYVYASKGRYNDAAEVLREIPSRALPAGTVDEAVRLLRAAPAPVQAASPPTMLSKGWFGWVYLYAGAPDRALDFSQGQADAGYWDANWLWFPGYAPVRKTEQFKALMRKAGQVEYWRERGWPEFCHPVGNDDFACS